MNRLRPTISLAVIAVLLTGTVRMASGWFPLTGSALFVREETDDEEIESQEANKRLGSKIWNQSSLNEEGDVSNFEVISGHHFLRQAAVDTVKQWR